MNRRRRRSRRPELIMLQGLSVSRSSTNHIIEQNLKFSYPNHPLSVNSVLHAAMASSSSSSPLQSQHPVVYLDYNATTPLAKEVQDAMRPFLEGLNLFGNPSSSHGFGAQTKRLVEEARGRVASFLGCEPSEVIFTSGGSESNNMAIKGFIRALIASGRRTPMHIITTAIEHYAILEVCRSLESDYGKSMLSVTYCPVDKYGRVDPSFIEQSIRPNGETVLISIMHANNEIGTLQPLKKISEIAKKHNIAFHTDAAQSLGKVPCNVNDLGVDMLSVCPHKFYGPKGCGALYIRKTLSPQPSSLVHGGGHEMGKRAGTENVMLNVGLGVAAQVAQQELTQFNQNTRSLRDTLLKLLVDALGGEYVHVNGTAVDFPEESLPNTLSVSFPGIIADTLLSDVDSVLAASAGCACQVSHESEESEGSTKITLSHVLQACGVDPEVGMGTIRLSVGKYSTEAEVRRAADAIIASVLKLRPSHYNEAKANEEDEVCELMPEIKDISSIRLTATTHGLGCGCKLRPQALERVLKGISLFRNENVLVGTETSDDAGIYKLNDYTALVQTVDFFTPVVDSPFDFGQIAAANALSDVWAMGGEPVTALNIAAFPSTRLPLEVLSLILKGAAEKAKEANVCVLGGHTIDDTEPKFGMSVTGIVHPDRIWRNNSVQQGDVLILTKPIGTGAVATALKRKLLSASEDKAKEATRVMACLNMYAKRAVERSQVSVHACTDVTGFGLLGHLKEMTINSGFDFELQADSVPSLPGAREYLASGIVPGGTQNNHSFVSKIVRYDDNIDMPTQLLLADAQTSGGLLICVSEADAQVLLGALKEEGSEKVPCAAVIGRFTSKGKGIIHVKREAS